MQYAGIKKAFILPSRLGFEYRFCYIPSNRARPWVAENNEEP
jgi:hypothetical protein